MGNKKWGLIGFFNAINLNFLLLLNLSSYIIFSAELTTLGNHSSIREGKLVAMNGKGVPKRNGRPQNLLQNMSVGRIKEVTYQERHIKLIWSLLNQS